MSGLHDLDNAEFIERHHGQLDMDAIAAEALRPKLRTWSLEYLCNGQSCYWRDKAETMQHADQLARQLLSERLDWFRSADAQLIACIEVAA